MAKIILCFTMFIVFSSADLAGTSCEEQAVKLNEAANTTPFVYDQFADDITFIGDGVTYQGKAAVEQMLDGLYETFDIVEYSCGSSIESAPNTLASNWNVYYYKAGCYNNIVSCMGITYFDDNGLIEEFHYVCPPEDFAALEYAASQCQGENQEIFLPEMHYNHDDKNTPSFDTFYVDPTVVGLVILCLLLIGINILLVGCSICDKKSKKVIDHY